jgi:citrate lyase beta subunit
MGVGGSGDTAPDSEDTALGPEDLAAIDAVAAPADAMLAAAASAAPGESVVRQPVHTVYVPADRVAAEPDGRLAMSWGAAARSAIHAHAPTALALAGATGLTPDVVEAVWPRLLDKLATEPIEDLRVDLEDGYGTRPDDIEDRDAIASAQALVASTAAGVAPPYLGFRIKSMEPATRRRGLRSLDLALGVLARSGLPPGFVVTLPKVSAVAQVDAMAVACGRLEQRHGLDAGRLRFEVQVEVPAAVMGPDGTATVARIVHAGEGRVCGLHFGTYDYSAALGVAGPYQSLEHPVADHAKAVMQVAAAGLGIATSDGSTNVLPVGDRPSIHAAWRLHARLVRRSLKRGFYQGWDLHPAQLPTRFLATYAFFRAGLEPALQRLRAYVEGVGGGTLDEPATARALAGFVLRGLHCGAVAEAELGIDPVRLRALAVAKS